MVKTTQGDSLIDKKEQPSTTMWIGRDTTVNCDNLDGLGNLYLFPKEPIQDEYGDFESKYTDDEMMSIGKELFPEITSSMGPVEVKLTIETSSMGVITSK